MLDAIEPAANREIVLVVARQFMHYMPDG